MICVSDTNSRCMASRGDVKGVQDLLDDGIDVNSIDLDGRTALHIAACEGHLEVMKLLVNRRVNIDARDRWGSTAAAVEKYYGNVEVYNTLKAHEALLGATDLLAIVRNLRSDGRSSEDCGDSVSQSAEQSFVKLGSVWQAPLYEITLNFSLIL